MTDRAWKPLATELVDQLRAANVLHDAAWEKALLAIPRHLFVPEFYDSRQRLVTASQDRRRWLRQAWADRALVIRYAQRADGVMAPLSSASQPTVVVAMLEMLAITGTERVLEIGTGTGYNAALLCHRLTDSRVISVDIEPDLVAAARSRLARLGYRPRLAVGDGEQLRLGEFDRVIVTCSIGRVPAAWTDQLAPGGRLLAPVHSDDGSGPLTIVDKAPDGQLLEHQQAAGVFFLPIRH